MFECNLATDYKSKGS